MSGQSLDFFGFCDCKHSRVAIDAIRVGGGAQGGTRRPRTPQSLPATGPTAGGARLRALSYDTAKTGGMLAALNCAWLISLT
jgi:hypothetical protein